MKHISLLICGILLGFFCLFGCNKTKTASTPTGPSGAGTLEIQMDADTLYFLPGDSTDVTGTVTAKDAGGAPVANLRVLFSVLRPGSYVRWSDAQRRDTTDAQGQVHFRFCTYTGTGVDTVVARTSSLRTAWPLVILPRHPGTLTVTTTPDTLWTPRGADNPVQVSIMLTDASNQPIVGARPVLFLINGHPRISPDTVITGADGSATCQWWPGTFGPHRMFVTAYGLRDTALVTVADTAVLSVSSLQLYMDADTLCTFSYDTAFAHGWVTARDMNGSPVAGVSVNVTQDQSIGFLQYESHATRDTTDANGRVYFHFAAVAEVGPQTIRAQMRGHVDTWNLTVLHGREPRHVTITAQPDTIRTDAALGDSARLSVTVSDSLFTGIAHMSPRFYLSGGNLSAFPATNNEGISEGYWWPNAPGSFRIILRADYAYDTTWVVVIDTTAVGVLRP
jgi:hypothetical protein